jgi:hypothetical protein
MARSRPPSVQQRLTRVESAVRKLTRTRVNVRREEHDQVVAALEKLERHAHDLDIQFKRIAQMQAELDSLKREWHRLRSLM